MDILGSIKKLVQSLFAHQSSAPSAPTGNDVTIYADTKKLKRRTADNTDEITTNDEVQTLTNKTFDNTTSLTLKDTNFTIEDDGDATKTLKAQLSGSTTSTATTLATTSTVNRTLTLPDVTDTLVGKTTTDDLSNKNLDAATVKVNAGTATIDTDAAGTIDIGGTTATGVNISRSGQTTTIKGDLQVDGTTTTVNSTTLDVADPNITVNNGGNQASADKTSGITVEMSDATDAKILYDKDIASFWKIGEAAAEAEVVTTSHAQTLTNKKLSDSTTTIVDNTDNTKQLAFETSNIATATTRTITWPDNDMNITGAEDGQAIVFDNATSTWVPGASGDSSFKVQSVTTSTITIKGGYILINGREYATYDGAGTARTDFGGDLVFTPAGLGASLKYYFYIDRLGLVDITTDDGRVLRAITNTDFHFSVENPYDGDIDTDQYIHIGFFQTDGSSNIQTTAGTFGTTATRYQDSWKNLKLHEDKIVAGYSSSLTQTIAGTGTFTVVDFDSKDYDDPNADSVTTGASWTFTVPRDGKYSFSAVITFNSSSVWTAGNIAQVQIFTNGSNGKQLDKKTIQAGFTGQLHLQGTIELDLLKDDTIDYRVWQNTGGNRDLNFGANTTSCYIHEITNYESGAVATPNNTYSERITVDTKNITGTDNKHKVTLPSWFTRKDYHVNATYHDHSAGRDFEVVGLAYDKSITGQLTLDLDTLSFDTNDYLDIVVGLGAKAVALPTEIIESETSISVSSAVRQEVTNIVLSPGTWDVQGSLEWNGSASQGRLEIAIADATAAVTGSIFGKSRFNYADAGAGAGGAVTSVFQTTVTTTTTKYLNAEFNGGVGSPSGTLYGYLVARRVK